MSTSFLGNKGRENELAYALQELEVSHLAKTASPDHVEETAEVKVDDALASVIVTLVKCAEQLDELGHPGAELVDEVLGFVEKEFLTQQA